MRVIFYPQLEPKKGIKFSNQHLRDLEREGRFPKRMKTSEHKQGRAFWEEGEIDAWIAERLAAREAAESCP